jgi:hypothetical protein
MTQYLSIGTMRFFPRFEYAATIFAQQADMFFDESGPRCLLLYAQLARLLGAHYHLQLLHYADVVLFNQNHISFF